MEGNNRAEHSLSQNLRRLATEIVRLRHLRQEINPSTRPFHRPPTRRNGSLNLDLVLPHISDLPRDGPTDNEAFSSFLEETHPLLLARASTPSVEDSLLESFTKSIKHKYQVHRANGMTAQAAKEELVKSLTRNRNISLNTKQIMLVSLEAARVGLAPKYVPWVQTLCDEIESIQGESSKSVPLEGERQELQLDKKLVVETFVERVDTSKKHQSKDLSENYSKQKNLFDVILELSSNGERDKEYVADSTKGLLAGTKRKAPIERPEGNTKKFKYPPFVFE